MKYLRSILTFLILINSFDFVHAQENLVEKERQKIFDFFNNHTPWETSPDSTMHIGFSFKIKMKFDTEGKINRNRIKASDPIAYKLFPEYKFLSTVNYPLFLKDKKRGTYIIPVLIEIIGSQTDEYYTNDRLLNYYLKTLEGRSMSKAMKSAFYIKSSGRGKTENYIYMKPIILTLGKRTIY